MTDLIKDLEAVALLAEKATPGEWPKPEFPENSPNEAFIRLGAGYLEFGGSMGQRERNAEFVSAAVNFIRTHHAEIAEALKDAERWRALHWAEAPMVTVTGSQLARGIRPGDYAVPWDWPVTSRTRIRMIVMHNSAGEAGE